MPSQAEGPVSEDCGVFVSSSLGADDNAGTKLAPFKALEQAIDKAPGRRVYVCAEELAGSVTLAIGTSIYGGLDCTKEWAYVGATQKSALVGDADTVALTIASTATGAEVADFTITAAGAKTPGSSSIAVLVDQATATFSRCDLRAADGAIGAAGDDAPSMPALAGVNGNAGKDACSADKVEGADQIEHICGAETSIGGQGGNGNKGNGTSGSLGLPSNPGGGQAGLGDDGSAGWSCNISGGNGHPGAPGLPGKEGAGAAMDALGSLGSSGFTPSEGSAGEAGQIGQGGGGGGGRRAAWRAARRAPAARAAAAAAPAAAAATAATAAKGAGRASRSSALMPP